MYKYSDIEGILKRISAENPAEMDKIDDIDESVFSRIEAKVLEKLSKVRKAKNMKTRIYLRAAVAAFGLIAVFSIAFYLIELPSTRAAKDPQGETAYENETQQVLTDADQNIGMPGYIPEGYVPDASYVSTGDFITEYRYINTADESLFILITIDGEPVQFPEGGQMTEEREYNGLPLVFLTVPGSPDINYLNFSDTDGHGVQIAATFDYDTIMEIMVSME